ncbi:unnamed protein product, partial [Effrenium voratum]
DSTRGIISIHLDPTRSPQGVRRFLDLVRDGFFQDQAIFRAVRGFVAQFGISDSRDMNEKWSPAIRDDPLTGSPSFEKGTVSFAGNGPNSRTTQVFIALSDLTGRLGRDPWETPIGRVEVEDLPKLDQIFTGYADSVDQEDLLRSGNSFARNFYPRLDYIKSCSVLNDPISALAKT